MKLLVGRTKDEREFRIPASVDEAESHCNANRRVWFLASDGRAVEVTVNGKVRRWKRDRNRIEVPVKYGLWEYYTCTEIGRILIPV